MDFTTFFSDGLIHLKTTFLLSCHLIFSQLLSQFLVTLSPKWQIFSLSKPWIRDLELKVLDFLTLLPLQPTKIWLFRMSWLYLKFKDGNILVFNQEMENHMYAVLLLLLSTKLLAFYLRRLKQLNSLQKMYIPLKFMIPLPLDHRPVKLLTQISHTVNSLVNTEWLFLTTIRLLPIYIWLRNALQLLHYTSDQMAADKCS